MYVLYDRILIRIMYCTVYISVFVLFNVLSNARSNLTIGFNDLPESSKIAIEVPKIKYLCCDNDKIDKIS